MGEIHEKGDHMKWMRGIVLCSVFLIVLGCDSTTATEDGEPTATPPTLAEVVGERIGTWYGTESLGPEQGFGEFVGLERLHISSCPPEFIAEGSGGPGDSILCLQGAAHDFDIKGVVETRMEISVLNDSTLVQRFDAFDLHLNVKRISPTAQSPSSTFWSLQADGSWYLKISNWIQPEPRENYWRWSYPDNFQLLEGDEECRATMLMVETAFLFQDCSGSYDSFGRTPWSDF